MIDLTEQLRAYVEAVAEPVTMDEIRARVDSPIVDPTPTQTAGPRRRRLGVVAIAAALVLAMVVAIAVIRSGGDDGATSVNPAGSPGTALRVLSNESCADHLASGDTVVLGARLSNRQRVCVIQHPETIEAFVDGRREANAAALAAAQQVVPFNLSGSLPGHLTLLTNVGPDVALIRTTFCDGTVIDVTPFTGPTGARFTAVDADVVGSGRPGFQAFDASGKALTEPFPATTPSVRKCSTPNLSELAPTWTSTPLTFDDPTIRGVSAITANDEHVVVTGTTFSSGKQATIFASAAELGAMTTTGRPAPANGPWSTLSSPNGFVFGALADPNPTTTAQHATIWWSPDGTTWTKAPSAPFVPRKQGSSPASMIRGIAWDKGQFVAVGDFYTGTPKRRQCCGLSPALWTSRDGVHWKRHILDLGDEFDPYMTSIVRFRGAWVATGRSGRFPLVVWRSKDLVHWDKTVVDQRDAGGQVTVASDALYVVGGIGSGPKTARRTTPAMWRSTDGNHWELVLTTKSQAVGEVHSLSPVLAAGDVLMTADGTTVFESLDGRHWAAMPTPMASAGDVSGMVFGQPTFVVTTGDAITAWSAVPHAPSGKWAAQCSILGTIRARNETQPTAPDPTRGQAGLDQLAQDYRRLIGEAPDARTRQLWRTVEPLFAHGATAAKPTIIQRDAVAELDSLLTSRCGQTTGDVFKIVVR